MMTPNFCRTPWKLTPDAIVDADGNPLISRGDNPQDDLICETVVDNANEIAGLRITVAQNKGDLERAKFIATVDRKAMEAHEAAIAEWRRRAEKAEAALSREPRGCPTPGVCSCPREQEGGEAPVAWQDDPSADERWNAGCDFAMLQLCSVVGADPKKVIWDSATETLDGDVQSTIGKIIEAGLGENWQDRPREQEGGEAPVAWRCEFKTVYHGVEGWTVMLRDEPPPPSSDCYRNLQPLYAHPAPLPADGWKEGAEAMREAAAKAALNEHASWYLTESELTEYGKDNRRIVERIATAIRSLPTPPASTEGGTDA